MKNFILKTLNFLLNIVMCLSVLYSLFNITMSFLPVEIQIKVYEFLHMSREIVTSMSISATINAGVLVASKIASTYTRIKLTAQLDSNDKVIRQDILSNEIVLKRQNEIINNLRVLEKLISSLLSIQEVTTKRNLLASDELVGEKEKEKYKKALLEVNTAKECLKNVDNITQVYEKTETKEVEIVKEVDELKGRV